MAKKTRFRDMVVLLPGIMGSVLQKDGKDLWAISGGALWRGLRSMGGSLDRMLLNGDDPAVDNLGDGIVASRIMSDAHIVPGLVKIDGYSKIAQLITDNFLVEQGSLADERPANFFEFPYDWRRDNRVAARHLKVLIDRQLPAWREFSGARDAKVILVAHSMGGLVSRHYLEVLGGWRDCKALITFGTPYRGSLNSLGFLANGYKKLFLDLTEVMRSFTSIYQLLPIYKVVEVGGAYHRIAETEGIPNVDRTRAAAALRFHREIEEAVEANRQDCEYRDHGYRILPVVGTHQPTNQSAELVGGTLEVRRSLPDWIDSVLDDGDGTVPRLSAIPIELSDEYRDSYVPERHGSLQCNVRVLGDILGRLQQMQARGLQSIRGPEIDPEREAMPAISVDLDDLYLPSEPVEIRAQLVNVAGDFGPIQARLERVDDEVVDTFAESFAPKEDKLVLRSEGLAPGLYRVTISTSKRGAGAPAPVHDLFEVVP